MVSQFFASLLKLMKPLATSLPVSQLALPAQLGDVTQTHIDPTGHLMLLFEDGCVKLEDLSETRAKLLSSVTKEAKKAQKPFQQLFPQDNKPTLASA